MLPGTLRSKDEIRLTPSVPNHKGSIWAKEPNPHKHWQLHFSFNAFGRGYMGGEGLAVWYAKDKGVEGGIYGSKDLWNGLGLFFDTADQRENRYTPFIYAVVNDGTIELGQKYDYLRHSIGGCFRDYRNAPSPVWGRLTYANRTLQLDIDLRQDGYAFTECFSAKNVDLPVGYHFGVSAMTGDSYSDDHDIISFETFEVDPPKRNHKKGEKEPEKITDDMQKKIDEVTKNVQQTTKVETEAGKPDGGGYQEAINPHVIQTLEENQFKIIEALNILQQKVGEAPIQASSGIHEKTKEGINQAVLPIDQKVNHINTRMDEIYERLNNLSEDIRTLFRVIAESNSKGDQTLRDVASKLDRSNLKLDEAHKAIREQPKGSHNWAFYTLAFLFGGIMRFEARRWGVWDPEGPLKKDGFWVEKLFMKKEEDEGVGNKLHSPANASVLNMMADKDTCTSLAFTPTGSQLISIGDDRKIIQWTSDGTHLGFLPSGILDASPTDSTSGKVYITDVCFFPVPTGANAAAGGQGGGGGEMYVAAGTDGKFSFNSLKSGRIEKLVEAHKGAITLLKWNYEASALLTA
ncbi:Protein ERGIC-53, partial [Chytridiales sp. JEL 0842]